MLAQAKKSYDAKKSLAHLHNITQDTYGVSLIDFADEENWTGKSDKSFFIESKTRQPTMVPRSLRA